MVEHGRLLRAQESAENRGGRAMARLALGDAGGALADAERYCELTRGTPGQAYALHARARAKLALEDFEGVIADAAAALTLLPGDPTALGLRARASAVLHRPQAAVIDLRALRASPRWRKPGRKNDLDPFASDEEACSFLGGCLILVAAERAERDPDGAVSVLEEALTVAAGAGDGRQEALVPALRELAPLLLAAEQYDRVLEVTTQLVGLVEGDADAHVIRAIALHRTGKLEAALEAVDHALSCDGEHESAHYERACLLAALGRSDEALASVERAIACGADTADLAVDEDLTPLRSDPRFTELLAAAG